MAEYFIGTTTDFIQCDYPFYGARSFLIYCWVVLWQKHSRGSQSPQGSAFLFQP